MSDKFTPAEPAAESLDAFSLVVGIASALAKLRRLALEIRATPYRPVPGETFDYRADRHKARLFELAGAIRSLIQRQPQARKAFSEDTIKRLLEVYPSTHRWRWRSTIVTYDAGSATQYVLQIAGAIPSETLVRLDRDIEATLCRPGVFVEGSSLDHDYVSYWDLDWITENLLPEDVETLPPQIPDEWRRARLYGNANAIQQPANAAGESAATAASHEEANNKGEFEADPSPGFDPARELEKLSDQSRLTHIELAEKLHLPAEALRQRLNRWREKNKGKGWEQVVNRQARQPAYLYHVWAIRHILAAAISSGDASV